jgi:CRISPR/Cas system CSM-associated protein Csm4 (group 5 of RAMP superfamily)
MQVNDINNNISFLMTFSVIYPQQNTIKIFLRQQTYKVLSIKYRYLK